MFIGLTAFGYALLIALTVMGLSNCSQTSHIKSPQETPENATPSVVHKDTGGAQPPARVAQPQQKSSGWLGSIFTDTKKSIAELGGKTGACGNDPALVGEWIPVVANKTAVVNNTLTYTECESIALNQDSPSTWSYKTSNGDMTFVLKTCKRGAHIACAPVGYTYTIHYRVEGSSLILSTGRGAEATYKKGKSTVESNNLADSAHKTDSGGWAGWLPDFSWLKDAHF